MNSLTIEIIVSTMNERVYPTIEKFVKLVDDRTFVTIIHQVTDCGDYLIPQGDFSYIRSDLIGLPLSRNLGLKHAVGDILVPTDDDVEFCDNFRSIIDAAFSKYSSADLISFKIKTLEGEPPYRKYHTKDRTHNIRSLLNVSSVEICLKRTSFQKNLAWDEDFGLGATFPGGLEVVFLQDARRRGKRMHYVNEFLVKHPFESSGKQISYEKISLRSSILLRSFNALGLPIILFFYFIKRKDFSAAGVSFTNYLRYSFLGVVRYLRWLKK